MANSKPGKNRAGKIIPSRAKIFFFFYHCKRSLEAVFSNMVSAGDGLQKRKGINKGFVISLPPSPQWVPASSQSSETQLRPWGRSAVHLCSHLPKSQNAPSSAWLPKECVSSGMLEPWHTQSWATPQPPTSSPCCQKTHLPSSCIAKNHNGQCLPTIVGWMDVHRPFFIEDNSQICL